MEFAFMADPAPDVGFAANENTAIIPTANMSAAEITAFESAITLTFTLNYEHDKCNVPPQTTGGEIHYMTFTAKTVDPDNGNAETFTKTTTYSED